MCAVSSTSTLHNLLCYSGLIHMNGRVYDNTIGRFLSVDPALQAPTNSQSVNPYSYVMNNPLSLVDPSGYEAACPDGDKTACPNEITRVYKGHNDTGTMDHLGAQKLAHFDAAVKAAFGQNSAGFEQHGQAMVAIAGSGSTSGTTGTTEPSMSNAGGSANQGAEAQKPNTTNAGDRNLTAPCADPSDCGGAAAAPNDSNSNSSQPQFVDPTGKGERGRDAAGNGDYQAPRTSASGKHYGHQGEDYLADAGQAVVADMSGRVTRVIVVYTAADVAHDPRLASFRGVEIVNPETGFSSKLFYVSVDPSVVGTIVHAGDRIGTAQDRAGIAPGMQNHVHVEIRQNGALVDPRDYIQPPN